MARWYEQTDICACGHTRATHFEEPPYACPVGDCPCEAFNHQPIECGQRDRDARILSESNIELLAALKATLPNLEWANLHGSRCEELLARVKEVIFKNEA